MNLSWRDKYQIATTVLFILIGVVMLARCALLSAPIESYVLAFAFVGYGLYRARYILRALRANRAS